MVNPCLVAPVQSACLRQRPLRETRGSDPCAILRPRPRITWSLTACFLALMRTVEQSSSLFDTQRLNVRTCINIMMSNVRCPPLVTRTAFPALHQRSGGRHHLRPDPELRPRCAWAVFNSVCRRHGGHDLGVCQWGLGTEFRSFGGGRWCSRSMGSKTLLSIVCVDLQASSWG